MIQGDDIELGGSGIGAELIDKALRDEAAQTATPVEEGVPEIFIGGQSLDSVP